MENFAPKTLYIPQATADLLKILDSTKGIGLDALAGRGITVGYVISEEWKALSYLFIDQVPLPVEPPFTAIKRPLMCMTFDLARVQVERLEQVARGFLIDEHSALSWCITCLSPIEEALEHNKRIVSVSANGHITDVSFFQ